MEITIKIIIFIVCCLLGLLLGGCLKKPKPKPEPEPEPEPEPLPDPNYRKWQLVDTTTERWARYVEGMNYINSDTKMALEMNRKDNNGNAHYVWTEEAVDYWDLPDEVWESGKADCDGLARVTSDGLGRFAKYSDVNWLEYYGYYRYYYYDKEKDKWLYKITLGGHAITAYKKDNRLLAFSNTDWWGDENFPDYVSIGEMTFPEGIVLIRCRHWETGKLQWIKEAKQGEILEGSNIFDREKLYIL